MNDSMLYDVGIIGGGLAGLSLAIQCADKGFSVVLFEKENYPFHKVCGEYISMESHGFLESLGVPLTQMNLPIIRQLKISDVKGTIYDFKLPLGGFGISRFLLDHTLYKIALSKGVNVVTDTKVSDVKFDDNAFSIQTSNGDFKCKVAAGSYGKRSNLDIKFKRPFISDKQNKLNNYIGIKYHVRYSQQHDTISLHNFNDGYCGISKIEDDKCCLCYLTTAKNLRKSNNSIREMEQQFLAKNPALKKIFIEAEFLYDEPLVISQISFETKTQVQDHMLMIGDAAGMITPLCGNGMSMALHASKIAFSEVDYFLQNRIDRNTMESNYSGSWKRKFATRLSIGRSVQKLFGGDPSTALFLKTMNALPPLANAIIRSTHGKPF